MDTNKDKLELERLRGIIYAVHCFAEMIVDTQTEMRPEHRELVQMIVDKTAGISCGPEDVPVEQW